MANYEFMQNRECEFFPCHKMSDTEAFNCLFCFCPLYALGDQCDGNYSYTKDGIKDCSNCLIPHRRENYSRIMENMGLVMELAKKRQEPTD